MVHRYAICQKHGIPFKTIEQDFPSRSAAYIWIIENQLGRRNINDLTKTDLIGRRYLEEKKAYGGWERTNLPSGQNDHLEKTSKKLAEQLNVGEKTVRRAADLLQ